MRGVAEVRPSSRFFDLPKKSFLREIHQAVVANEVVPG
jgi:hypothetical protein